MDVNEQKLGGVEGGHEHAEGNGQNGTGSLPNNAGRKATAGSSVDEKMNRASKQNPSAGRLNELKRFTLWETRTHFYLVAYNTSQTLFRILKLGRVPESVVERRPNDTGAAAAAWTPEGSASKQEDASGGASQRKTDWTLNVTADRVVYTRSQMTELLDMISEGNKSTGGLKEIGRFFGIVGFIRFTSTYYMVLISRRSVVGLLGGHYIYHCDETKIIPVCPQGVLTSIGNRTKALDQEESRLLHTFKQVDLSKNFYFSYTYDLTKTLQDNLTQPIPTAEASGSREFQPLTAWGYNEKFIWNHHLLLPAFASSEHNVEHDSASEWVLPLVYGFVDQAKLRVLNCTIHVTLIARRSRHFAGARFLKRGTDENGHVANDVETEQIVSDALTTPLYAPDRRRWNRRSTSERHQTRGPNPRYTSYVMHRGSIPIFWTQDSTNMSPRPPIEISVVDPFYSSAALHFDDMLRRYGHPIIVLNLIKSKEKQPREVKLLQAFGECVGYLNQFLPADKKLRYIAWDMSRASKSRDQDVIGVLEDIAEETINATKFFHSGPEPTKFAFGTNPSNDINRELRSTILLQSGVARVNCVDCLDRTNAAQFIIGKAAFGHQLYALGLLSHPSLPFDSDAIDMLTEMYHDLGDTIALQYGGSHLVNTMETYRKINQWTSHSRDMLEGLKRYYSNSFVDAEKQAAINLFLGVDSDLQGFRPTDSRKRRHYQRWFTADNLYDQASARILRERRLQEVVDGASSFWTEYYRPSLFTDLMRHHAFKMTAIHQQNALPTSSPSPTLSSGMSAVFSPPMTSPMSKAVGRMQAHSVSSPVQTETSMSPFTSRIPLPGPQMPGTSGSLVSFSQPGSPRSQQQRALIGGMRRWMSLNRGEDDASAPSINPGNTSSSARRVSARTTLDSSTPGDGGVDRDLVASSATTYVSAWPTWDELTGASVAAPPVEALSKSLSLPTVSVEEAKEYASWLNQFRNVTFDAGPHDAIPEPAALLSAQHVQQPSSHMMNASTMLGGAATPLASTHSTGVGGAGREASVSESITATLAPAALIAPGQLHSIGVRRPATQKQRQQIAEADARLYDRDVGLSNGEFHLLGAIDYPNDNTAAGVDPILQQYPLTANALQMPPADVKVQRFARWLNGHAKSLPAVTAAR